ncbi:DMT family transporter [Amycolatopsis nigrescens]|uniref:DMT family transporter n=1 Tax=Amycolatopsis nigrescens TaxID=381445 RepID=UPI0003636FEF|nr:DMT family transporter [Amycolatopsis nigrescens]
MRISLPIAVATVLVWATGYPAGAFGVATMSPFLLTTFRFGLAAVVLTVFALAARARFPRGRLLWHTAVAGVLGQAVQFCGLYGGLHAGVPPAVSALVIGLNPVLTALLASVALRERISGARLAGLALGVLAVFAALGGRVLAAGGIDAGTGLTLLGLAGLAASGVYQQRFCRAVDVRAGAAVQLAVATPAAAVLALLEHGGVTDWPRSWLVLGWLVLVNSALGAVLYLTAVRQGGAAKASMLFSVIPSVTALISWPLMGTAPDPGVLVGLALGAVACLLGTRDEGRETAVSEVTSSGPWLTRALQGIMPARPGSRRSVRPSNGSSDARSTR